MRTLILLACSLAGAAFLAAGARAVEPVNGTLSVDPVFANYPLDLHLQSTSMCIGAGTPVGAPLTDYDGDARDPAAPDIGADEF